MDKRLCTCCDRKTCPKYQVPIEVEEPSSQKSSGLEYSDKETQKTATPSSAVTSDQNVQATKSPASSETDTYRNNENLNASAEPPSPPSPPLSPPPTAPTAPTPTAVTNLPKFNPTDCANYPSIMSPRVTHPQQAQQHRPTPCPCSRAFECHEGVTPYLPDPFAECRDSETCSSSSTMSDHFPIRLKLHMKPQDINAALDAAREEHITSPTGVQRNVYQKWEIGERGQTPPPMTTRVDNSAPQLKSRSKGLQRFDITDPLQSTPKADTLPEDEYYSCSSEHSDVETVTRTLKKIPSKKFKLGSKSKKDRDCAILKLLHEVIHLMKENRQESSDTPKETSSSITPNTKSSDSTQLPASSSSSEKPPKVTKEPDKDLQSCGPCQELQTLLNTANVKREESQSVIDKYTKMHSKFTATEDQTLSSATNETIEDECSCTDHSTGRNSEETKAQQFLGPPCPCLSYFMTLLASQQGMSASYSLVDRVPTGPPPQLAQKECRCKADESVQKSKMQETTEIREAAKETKSQQDHLSVKSHNSNAFVESNSATKQQQSMNETLEDNNQVDESPQRQDLNGGGYEELELAVAEKAAAPSFDNEHLHLYGGEEDPAQFLEMTATKDPGASAQMPQDLALHYMERLSSLLANDMCMPAPPSNLLAIGGETDEGRGEDYVIDSFYEEYANEESELDKEKRSEKRKRKDPCECCHCRESAKGKCMSIATPQQVDNADGTREFKYFIDSIILDLDAMEHARRKCDVMQNVCRSKAGNICSRESFPVTIVEVQDLGSTSLYVKWIIHDCYGIGGYEIFVDGYLTNRFYHSRHEAAVVTDIDVTIPHKIALVAQPSLRDDSLKMLCSPHKKSKTKCQIEKSYTHATSASLWTPCIYLYDPAECKITPPVRSLEYTA